MKPLSQEIALEEFKAIVSTCREFLGLYLRSFVLYLAVLGILIKLFLDALQGSPPSIAIYIAGLVINIAAIVLTLIGRAYYRRIVDRCEAVCKTLDIPNVYSPGLVSVAWGFLLVILLISGLWVCLAAYL